MSVSKGYCYLNHKVLGKTAMKNHLLKLSPEGEKLQDCFLIKVEGAYDKNYWLYLDIPITSTLSSLDTFLRRIWLECCGHLSMFYYDYDNEIPFSRKLSKFEVGDAMLYDYDFGSTTTLLITIIGRISRPYQKNAVRLLARNLPFHYECALCGKRADWIDAYKIDTEKSPFLCIRCAKDTEEEEDDRFLLPVTNSPRMGVCGYEGERDQYPINIDEP